MNEPTVGATCPVTETAALWHGHILTGELQTKARHAGGPGKPTAPTPTLYSQQRRRQPCTANSANVKPIQATAPVSTLFSQQRQCQILICPHVLPTIAADPRRAAVKPTIAPCILAYQPIKDTCKTKANIKPRPMPPKMFSQPAGEASGVKGDARRSAGPVRRLARVGRPPTRAAYRQPQAIMCKAPA